MPTRAPAFYSVQEATVAFHKLSSAQFNTGWVLCQLGRAYYEMVDYPAAANVFEFARQADRHRLEVKFVSNMLLLVLHEMLCYMKCSLFYMRCCAGLAHMSETVLHEKPPG